MLDKMMRVQDMVTKLSLALKIDNNVHHIIQDAASLAMSDLATAVVTELTSLSGIMARHYALRDGYSEQVVYLVLILGQWRILLRFSFWYTNASFLCYCIFVNADCRGFVWDHSSQIFWRYTSKHWSRNSVVRCWQVKFFTWNKTFFYNLNSTW